MKNNLYDFYNICFVNHATIDTLESLAFYTLEYNCYSKVSLVKMIKKIEIFRYMMNIWIFYQLKIITF